MSWTRTYLESHMFPFTTRFSGVKNSDGKWRMRSVHSARSLAAQRNEAVCGRRRAISSFSIPSPESSFLWTSMSFAQQSRANRFNIPHISSQRLMEKPICVLETTPTYRHEIASWEPPADQVARQALEQVVEPYPFAHVSHLMVSKDCMDHCARNVCGGITVKTRMRESEGEMVASWGGRVPKEIKMSHFKIELCKRTQHYLVKADEENVEDERSKHDLLTLDTCPSREREREWALATGMAFWVFSLTLSRAPLSRRTR